MTAMKTTSLFLAALLTFSGALVPAAIAQTPAPPAAGDRHQLLTRTFTVPPDFHSRGSTPAAAPQDPFGVGPPPKQAAPSAREVLESLGVSFPEGAAASLDRNNSRLVVRNTPDQLDLVETLVTAMTDTGIAEGILHLEVISLPMLAARKALIAHPDEADLYKWLDAELDKKDSGVALEHLHALRIRSGQRSKVEGVDEFAYSTEWESPAIPQNISLAASPGTPVPAAAAAAGTGPARNSPPWPHTSSMPGGFTFRNLGWTVEAELVFSEDHKVADINLAPEISKVIARVSQGMGGEVTQPVFETQKLSSQVQAWTGQPALVGTLSPASDTGVPGNTNQENRVWLLFVTATRPR